MRQQTMRKLDHPPALAASEPSPETVFSDDKPTLRRTSRFRAHDEDEEAPVRPSMRQHSIASE